MSDSLNPERPNTSPDRIAEVKLHLRGRRFVTGGQLATELRWHTNLRTTETAIRDCAALAEGSIIGHVKHGYCLTDEATPEELDEVEQSLNQRIIGTGKRLHDLRVYRKRHLDGQPPLAPVTPPPVSSLGSAFLEPGETIKRPPQAPDEDETSDGWLF